MTANSSKIVPRVIAAGCMAVLLILGIWFALNARPKKHGAEASERVVQGELIAPKKSDESVTTLLQVQPIATQPASTPTEKSGSLPPMPLVSKPAVGVEEKIENHLRIGFERLSSFKYLMPDDLTVTNSTTDGNASDQIPASVRALDEKPVALKGYMLPLKVEKGVVTELLLMRDQSMCCYGAAPKINEWVSVKMVTDGIKPIMDQPVTLLGTLHVGEMRENGYLVGIYAMDGEKMIGPSD